MADVVGLGPTAFDENVWAASAAERSNWTSASISSYALREHQADNHMGSNSDGNVMLDWPKKYHSYLVSRSESLSPRTRWLEVRPLLFPWCVPLIVACLVCFVLRLNDIGRLILVLPAAAVSLVGMLYAGLVFLIYGVRADIRRMNESKRKNSGRE